MRATLLLLALAPLALALAPSDPVRRTAASAVPPLQPGDPLRGVTPAELALFRDGKGEFEQVETPADGLGPVFNGASCVECHSGTSLGAATGGFSTAKVAPFVHITETRFGFTPPGGLFDPLVSLGGSLLQTKALSPDCAETLPPPSVANTVARRRTTALFGFGLLEAIPDREIASYASLQRYFYRGQSGYVNTVTSVSDGRTHVGRFGWKCQHALLLDFSADAYVNEMGITNALFPHENAPGGDLAKLAACDHVPDPEDKNDDIHRFASFMRYLAPIARGGYEPRGERLFAAIGCAVCHLPAYRAESPSAAIDGTIVRAYSDFLLHDVGTGDGIVQNGDQRTADMIRTAPLWGLRLGETFLHDGSAATPLDAILRHGGQATGSRLYFQALPAADRAAVLRFLDTL
jgi:CxxC motif-containing protein (DUF1111 family)